MSGCRTCGGYGMRHDPIAHDAEPESYGHDCDHTSLQHGADGCNVPGCLCAFMSWDEEDYAVPVMHPDEIARQVRRTRDYIRARYGGCGECTPEGNGPCLYGCATAVVPVVRFDGGKPPHQVHFPTRPGWRWGWCDCPIGETHNENARP